MKAKPKTILWSCINCGFPYFSFRGTYATNDVSIMKCQTCKEIMIYKRSLRTVYLLDLPSPW